MFLYGKIVQHFDTDIVDAMDCRGVAFVMKIGRRRQ